jgi:hypothetical protein
MADQTVVEGKRGRRNMAAPEEDDGYEGEGGSDYLAQVEYAANSLGDLDFNDELEEDDDQDIEWNENTANNIPHSISNATLPISSSQPPSLPSDPQEETLTFIIPVVEPEETTSFDPTSLQTEPEKTNAVPRVTRLQLENDERSGTAAAVPEAESEHIPESSMSAEQRIIQLEEKVAKLDALRLVDAASISRSSRILPIYIYIYIY